ncbi:MAG: pyrroline-5-carboxylate reductase family protein [Candidatus Cryptobacteroides sp.]
MNVTIIGAGNMGGAAAIGIAKAGKIPASCITVTARHQSTLARFSEYDIRTSLDNREAVRDADIVVIAVKPWVVPEVCSQLKDVLDYSRQQIVSFAPGVSPEDMLGFLDRDGEKPALTYSIPNTAIEVCQGMTFVSRVSASEEQEDEVASLFECTGLVMKVPFRQLMPGTALASCGIAYALRYIRAASEGGVELGFYASDAVRIVSQTVKGAAALLEAHGTHPEQEIDKVTTPGGLTIRGLNAMEKAGFTNAVIAGLKGGK